MACTQYFLWFSDFSAWIFRLGFFGQSIKPLFVYSTISMCIIQALCVFYNLYVYSIIPLCILHSLCIFFNLYMYHTSSMCILQSPCVFYNPFVYSIISMCILQSLCVFYNLFVYSKISLCILRSLWCHRGSDLPVEPVVGVAGVRVRIVAAEVVACPRVLNVQKEKYTLLGWQFTIAFLTENAVLWRQCGFVWVAWKLSEVIRQSVVVTF